GDVRVPDVAVAVLIEVVGAVAVVIDAVVPDVGHGAGRGDAGVEVVAVVLRQIAGVGLADEERGIGDVAVAVGVPVVEVGVEDAGAVHAVVGDGERRARVGGVVG